MTNRLSPPQIHGARGMLGWSILDLAKAAGVSVSTVKRMEVTGQTLVAEKSYAVVLEAFEASGIRFLRDGDGAAGMMLVDIHVDMPSDMMAFVAMPL